MRKTKDPLQGLSRTKTLWTNRQPSNTPRDMFFVYEFLRRLSTPYNQWPAFKAGIIDGKGNILKSVQELDAKQKQSWNYIDVLSVGIKKLVDRVPNTRQKLASITGTMLLMRERKNPSNINDQELNEQFNWILNTLEENAVAVNSAGAGNVAAIGVGPQGEPPKPTALLMKLLKRKGLHKNGL